jgi:large subunit ribosomal protein L1
MVGLLRLQLRPSVASSSRLFTTSSPTLGKSPPGKGKMALKRAKQAARLERDLASGQVDKRIIQSYPLEEAVKVFQSVEVARPLNAYELHVVTTVSSHQANALRGRLALPKEARIKSERILIFAEDDSPASKAVRNMLEANASLRENIVLGGQEMIQDVVDSRGPAGGQFTKVLSTQSLLPQVAKSLARSLGPKGLMPNIKRGTVVNTGEEMQQAIREAQGAMSWRGDRNGVVRGGESWWML